MFFAQIGDYASILDPRIVNVVACPSMKLDSIRLYMDFNLLAPVPEPDASTPCP